MVKSKNDKLDQPLDQQPVQVSAPESNVATPKWSKKKWTIVIAAAFSGLVLVIPAFVIFSGGDISSVIDGKKVEIKLVDALSGDAIARTDVEIYGDNGVRCIKAPCNSQSQDWSGKSDGKGLVLVPSKKINSTTSVRATGYSGGRSLDKDSDKVGDRWTMELDPLSTVTDATMRLKIIDSNTNKPLPNAPVVITGDKFCQTSGCSVYYFAGTTNKLGNVFYPSSTATDTHWVFINGYTPKELNLKWGEFKTTVIKKA